MHLPDKGVHLSYDPFPATVSKTGLRDKSDVKSVLLISASINGILASLDTPRVSQHAETKMIKSRRKSKKRKKKKKHQIETPDFSLLFWD